MDSARNDDVTILPRRQRRGEQTCSASCTRSAYVDCVLGVPDSSDQKEIAVLLFGAELKCEVESCDHDGAAAIIWCTCIAAPMHLGLCISQGLFVSER
jgi:hypothetical protein